MDWINTPELKKQFMDLVNEYVPMLKEILDSDGVQAMVEFAYYNADNMTKKTGLDKQIKCVKGCNFCCNSEITVSSYEASFVFSYVQQFNIPVNYKQLKKLNEVGIENLPFKQKACPLLDKQGSCSVYKIRPMICRIHSVINNPKYCDFSKYKGRSKMGRIMEAYALTTALAVLDGRLNAFAKPVELHKALYENLEIPTRGA